MIENLPYRARVVGLALSLGLRQVATYSGWGREMSRRAGRMPTQRDDAFQEIFTQWVVVRFWDKKREASMMLASLVCVCWGSGYLEIFQISTTWFFLVGPKRLVSPR